MFECPECGGAVETTSHHYFCVSCDFFSQRRCLQLDERRGTLSWGESKECIQWECAESTIWVARQYHEFIGMVELHLGRFVANDTLHETYRTYGTLSEAKEALEFAAR